MLGGIVKTKYDGCNVDSSTNRSSYFHDYIYQKPNVEIRFIRGRLKFGDGKNSAPFPSMVVIFKSKKDGT